jgi:protein-disulfide isomerase
MRTNWKDTLLNASTIVLATFAIALGGFRVYQIFFADAGAVEAPVVVTDWRTSGNGVISLGREDAAVSLVMFSDFLCIHCRAAAPDVKRIRSEFPGDVRFVYRNLPLQSASFPAAIAAVCAHEQGAFDAVHDYLFAQQGATRALPWDTVPEGVSIPDPDRFLTCLQSDSISGIVAQDTLEAMRVGVSGTPSFLVDSLLYSGNIGYEALRSSIEQALGQRSITARFKRRMSRSSVSSR